MNVKRDLVLAPTVAALALAYALAWAGPIVASGTRAEDQARPQRQPDQAQVKPATFRGMVIRIDDDYVLHAGHGTLYKLDDANRAKPFVGKLVKVTGELDEQTNVIHVESIQVTA